MRLSNELSTQTSDCTKYGGLLAQASANYCPLNESVFIYINIDVFLYRLIASNLLSQLIQLSGTPPRVALIGAAGYAIIYIDWLIDAHKKGTVNIVAATILPDEQTLASAMVLKDLSVRIYDNHKSMFEREQGKLDLCFIPTGIQWHARMTIAALESGCNVLVEKPIAGCVKDVDLVRDAEKRLDRWVAVGFQDMHAPETLTLKKSLLDGAIGRIQSISMFGAWPRPISYYTRNKWAGRLRADGAAVFDSPLNNAFAHFVNLSLFLAGDELHSSSNVLLEKAELYHAHRIESFDTAVVQATTPNGIDLWFGVTHATSETREPFIRIVGDSGRAEWKHERLITLSPLGKPPTIIQIPNIDETRGHMFASVIQRLFDDAVPICDSKMARGHAALIESVHQSGEILTVPPGDIDAIFLESLNSTVPAIRNIIAHLENAFENVSDLGDISKPPIRAHL
jgi:predicted dehydrogenase